MLAAIGFIGPVLRDGDVGRAIADAVGRKAVGALVTEVLRFSLSRLASF